MGAAASGEESSKWGRRCAWEAPLDGRQVGALSERRQASPPGRHGASLHLGCGLVDMGRRCVWKALLFRQRAGTAAEGAALRERRRLDGVLRRF